MLKVYTWERPHVHHYRLFIMHVCVYARASVFNSSSVNRVDTVRWMAGMCIPPPLVIWNFPPAGQSGYLSVYLAGRRMKWSLPTLVEGSF